MSLEAKKLTQYLHVICGMVSGPVGSVLVKKFGCRIAQIIGGACLLLGIGLSALSMQSWHALILYGVLSGTSFIISVIKT